MLNDIKHYANDYVSLKTQKGLPSTPAGKDRLTGAFALMDNADQELATLEKEIVSDGKYKNLKDFMNSKEYMEVALNQINEKISNIDEFEKGDKVRSIEERYLLAQQAAFNIKLNPDKYKDFEQYKNLSATDVADRLMYDEAFEAACKDTLAKNNRSGAEMVKSGEKLLDSFKAKKLDDGLEKNNTAVNKHEVKKPHGKGSLGF